MDKKYDRKWLLGLYTQMCKIRLSEESLVEPILSGEIRTPCHLYTGEEAIAVGVCACLRKDDYIFGTHRSHGHYLAKGGDLRKLIAEIYCKEGGCSKGRGGSMHVIDTEVGLMGAAPIVAGTISLAMGAALACHIRGDNRIVVSFFGDGATGEGVFYESLNFASLKKLPIIFACENNFYSTHMSLSECRANERVADAGRAFCVDSIVVDGNNVLEVYEKSRKATEKCRGGKGPVLMEFLTYRLRGHVGPDDNIQGVHTDIRPPEEIEEWKRRDPVIVFERYLLNEKIASYDELEGIKEKLKKEVEDAHGFARKSPPPSSEEIGRYVFR